jgi:uncharacterized protein (DUF2062 family)
MDKTTDLPGKQTLDGTTLAGALWLVLLIFLYRWTLDMLPKRRARRLAEKPVQAQEA